MEGDTKVEYEYKWRTLRENNPWLEKKCVQMLYMTRGQCIQVLLD